MTREFDYRLRGKDVTLIVDVFDGDNFGASAVDENDEELTLTLQEQMAVDSFVMEELREQRMGNADRLLDEARDEGLL
jgi:hypothetical protein